MRRFCALYGILSPLPQRPFCVVGRGWGEGKMKVRGRGGGGGIGPSSHRLLRACYFLFFNYYFSPVVYPFSCREQYRLKSLLMLGIHRPEFALWNFILAKFLYKVFFDNNDRRNLKLKTRQIRGGHRSYVTWRNFWEFNEEKRKT